MSGICSNSNQSAIRQTDLDFDVSITVPRSCVAGLHAVTWLDYVGAGVESPDLIFLHDCAVLDEAITSTCAIVP